MSRARAGTVFVGLDDAIALGSDEDVTGPNGMVSPCSVATNG